MGINGLSKFLKDNYPEIFEPIHLSEYQYKQLAIDTDIYMWQYKSGFGFNWINAFLKLVAMIRRNNVHCVFVYGTGHPQEKNNEREKRAETRAKLEERTINLENDLEIYYESKNISSSLQAYMEKRKLNSVQELDDAVKKLRKSIVEIKPEDYKKTKELFDILDIPYLHSHLEAELLAADLCIQNKVDAVVSEDTDILAYGAPCFLTKIDPRDGSCVRIEYENLLKALNFTSDQFLDFCIMCGTDYNPNIYKVGPVKAFKLITDYKSIENVAEQTGLDVSILNYKRTRELFRDYKKCDKKIGYCGTPNFSDLAVFLAKSNVRTELELLEESFNKEIIIPESFDIDGLSYYCKFMNNETEAKIVAEIDKQPWNTDLSRRTQHYGYKYDYKDKNAEYIGELPDWLNSIVDMAIQSGVLSSRPNQAIINEYLPGQGISPHTDAKIFGNVICSISLGSNVIMEFSKGIEVREILLRQKSIIVLENDARWSWKHSIPARKHDVVDGLTCERGRRLSITFRTVN